MSKKGLPPTPDVDMHGKTVIITGANTGIGKETAIQLVNRGARVIMACRSRERAEVARQEIISATGGNEQNIIFKPLDLASLPSIKRFADDINETEERIDILVNNAGVFTKDRRETEQGFEMMFGVNHIGHFYLTNLLLEKIKASAPSRIVIVSSVGHRFSKMDFKDPQQTRKFKYFFAYCKSKTANVLHSVQLAKLLEGTGVSVYSLHPGAVKSELARDIEGSFTEKFFRAMVTISGQKWLTPEDGAKTTLYCCLEPSIAEHSGRYYSKCKESSAKDYATNPEKALKLWELSENLCSSV